MVTEPLLRLRRSHLLAIDSVQCVLVVFNCVVVVFAECLALRCSTQHIRVLLNRHEIGSVVTHQASCTQELRSGRQLPTEPIFARHNDGNRS